MDPEPSDNVNQKYKELRSFSDNLDNKARHSDAKATQLGGFYVIFEAIMTYAGPIPSSDVVLMNGKRWIPFCLSAAVSVAFWLAFVTTVNDCLRTKRQQDLIFLEQERLHRKIFSIRNRRRQDEGGSAATAAADQQSLAKHFAVLRFQRYAYVGVVYSAFCLFTLVASYAVLPSSVPRVFYE